MKLLFSIVFVFALVSRASAQNPKKPSDSGSYSNSDQTAFSHSAVPVQGRRKIFKTLESLKKAIDEKDCESAEELLAVDFSKYRLITYQVSGDCHVQDDVEVRQKPNEKKYEVLITEIYDGCRANDRFQGWIVVDKIPADHKTNFGHTNLDTLRLCDIDRENLEDNAINEISYDFD